MTVRNPGTPRIHDLRPLVTADLEGLRQKSAGLRIAKLRDSHHAVARMLVSGLSVYEVGQQTGYSYQRLAILQSDPSFQELMAKYRGKVDEAWLSKQDYIQEQIVAAKAKSLRLINEKLDDEGADIPLRSLLPIFDSMADRSGHMKVSGSINANVNYAKNLEDAIRRVKTIKGEAA